MVMMGNSGGCSVLCFKVRLFHVLGILNTLTDYIFLQSIMGLLEHYPVLSQGPSKQLGLLFSEKIRS